jgi:hypothetical protein
VNIRKKGVEEYEKKRYGRRRSTGLELSTRDRAKGKAADVVTTIKRKI